MAKTWHAVGILIEDGKGELLVTLRHKNRPEGGVYGLVGGGIEKSETKLEAAVREVFEETKLIVNPSQLEFLKTYDKEWQSTGFDIKFDLFRLRLNVQPKIFIKPDEATSYLWESPKKLYKRKDLMKGLYIILKDIYKL